MRTHLRFLLVPCLLLAFLAAPAVVAAPKGTPPPAFRFAKIFTDNMVLQQGIDVPVWGKADPGEAVTVKFAGQTRQATAGKGGRYFACDFNRHSHFYSIGL